MIFYLLLIYIYASIPFSLLVGFMYKKDIRKEGSGNIGGSNLGRTCGNLAFVIGFILDMSKGALAVIISSYAGINPLLLLVLALIGHTFSPFIKFKGGKGVATAFGFVVAYTPIGALIAISFFLVILKVTKYVSLSSILAILVYFVYSLVTQNIYYALFILLLWVFVTYLHRTNLVKIKSGTESKISWM